MTALPNPDDLVLKLILVGDSGVGKSCLLKAFMGDPFKGVYTSTIGVDFEIKPLTLHNRTVNLQIWDTAGQERFRTITTSYYRSADAIMLVFDLTEPASFASLDIWMEDVRLYSQRGVEVVLLGNKCDLAEERRVEYRDAKAYAEKNRFLYLETSAKSRVNVDKAITQMTEVVYAKKVGGQKAGGGQGGAGVGAVGGEGAKVDLAGGTEKAAKESACPC